MPQSFEKYQTERGETLINLEGVDIENNGNLILSDVSLEVCKGDFIYLVGKVGSGKSSIIKSIIAEIPVVKGKASVGKYDLVKIKRKHIPYLRRGIGVVFQDFQLLMDRSVMENLIFVLEATGWKKKDDMAKRATEVLEMVGMASKAFSMPHQLSGGEQQRVAIARALINNPSIILADEPTGNLDEETASDIMKLFSKIHTEQQPAILMVTHNKELYKRFPGRVLVCEKKTISELDQEVEFTL